MTTATISNVQNRADQPVPDGMRLLRGTECWWVIHGSKHARLPLAAVIQTEAGNRVLDDVLNALRERDFFTKPAVTAYAVTVLTATACNLGCAYCFQNLELPAAGSFAPPRIRNEVLTPDRVRNVADFIARQMAAASLDQTTLLLFGGEPLLNPEGSLELLRALKPMNLVDAEMVTNGVLLHRRLAGELSRAGLNRVQITFDGAESVHDTIRVTRNGRGTYAKILRNVAQAAEETDLSWHFRVNISHHNLDGLEKLIDDLGDVVPGERASLHLALIDDSGLGYENEVGYAPEYAQRFKQLHTQAIAYGMHVPLSKPMTDCPYCSAVGGAEGAVVNADGQLYSCWENAGREGWDIGDVVNGYRPTPDIQDKWVACDFEIKSHGTQEATRLFFEEIDAAVLDDTYAQRRSTTPGPSPAG